jgi:Ni2+-binding GTPase involved in maturation of urease and hydrogenase
MKVGGKLLELHDDVLRVLCVGPVQSGKTSFIDSMSSTLRDEIYMKATRGCTAAEKYKDGHLVSTTDKVRKLHI